MSRSSNLAIGILGGVVLGVAVAALVAYNRGPRCPICGGRLLRRNRTMTCASCGVRFRLGEH